RVVIDKQNLRRHGSFSDRRKDNVETSAALRTIRRADGPAKLMGDLVADREAEPCSLARRLGREEWFEHARQHIVGDAGAAVVEPNENGAVFDRSLGMYCAHADQPW